MHADLVFIGLGSNLGDRSVHLAAGLAGLREAGLSIRALSSLYLAEPILGIGGARSGDEQTPGRRGIGRAGAGKARPVRAASGEASTVRAGSEPADRPDHPWYFNCVAAVAGADAARLLEVCLEVEAAHGRLRSLPAAAGGDGTPRPRTLDLDLLLAGASIIEGPELRLPHPRMHERRFVLEPLCEIDPNLHHPVQGATVKELLDRLGDRQGVWMLAPPLTPTDSDDD